MTGTLAMPFSPCFVMLTALFIGNGQAMISREIGENSTQIKAERGELPWVALLEIPNSGFCSGTIISPTSVLSAALCLNGIKNPGRGTAYAGNVKYTEPEDFDLLTQNRSVVEYHLYDENSIEKYNFMLVKIDPRWTWSPNVRPILITGFKGLPKHFMAPCTVSGLGYGSSADRDGKIVRSVDMWMASGQVCTDAPEDSRMCSLYPNNRGSCVGDIGGSVVCNYEPEDRLYGIISEVEHGEVEGQPIHCKLPARASGYEFVGFYMPWIRKVSGDLPSAEEVREIAVTWGSRKVKRNGGTGEEGEAGDMTTEAGAAASRLCVAALLAAGAARVCV